MGSIAWRMFASLGVAAIFEEPNELGAALDPTAGRNAPAASPESYLDMVRFSTALDILEVVSDTTVNISHAAVAASSGDTVSNSDANSGTSSQGFSSAVQFNQTAIEHDLVTHGLGYVPDFRVVVGVSDLMSGRPVQTDLVGGGRYCSAYATTTKIILREYASVSDAGLAAADISYRVLVLREPRDAAGDKLFDFDPVTGITKLGFDRFSTDRAYLQVVAGGSPFGIAYGKTMDLKNGAMRFVDPDGTVFDPIPNPTQGRIVVSWPASSGLNTYTGALGSSMHYDGTFAGSEEILVQAP